MIYKTENYTTSTQIAEANIVNRIGSLDSLRGIAALVVVLYHMSLVVPGVHDQLLSFHPLRIILAGTAAVYIFFVLSGFVLYLSLQRHNRGDWLTFAVRRLARLWPPIAAAVLISAGLYLLVEPRPMPALAGWFTDSSWIEPPSVGLIGGHFLLFDGNRFQALDNPMWSLVVEMRLSLTFPILAACIGKRPILTLLSCVIISIFSRHVVSAGDISSRVNLFFTLQFLDLFALGAFMAHYRDTVVRLVQRLPVLAVVSVILLGLVEQARLYPYVMYASAVVIVAASISYPALDRFYKLKPLVWLGERSFSLYLTHVPLILTAIHLLSPHVPMALILAGAFPACLSCAEVFWLFVERPSIRLSRALGLRLALRHVAKNRRFS